MASQDHVPFPTDPDVFDDDSRIAFSKASNTHILEDEQGNEWEWLDKHRKWVPVLDEELVEQQSQIYKIDGVDEDEPAFDHRKRKAGADGENGNAANKKQKPEEAKKPRQNTAVYITSLPEDADAEEIYQVFSKYGVIAESLDTNEPRIKLYHDEAGKFKGEALVVFFRPESVQLAINMLDDTDFRLGEQVITGKMQVKEADASYKKEKDVPAAAKEPAAKKGTSAFRDRQKVIKKAQEMNNRLADWDDDDPQAIADTSNRWDKVVVLKYMFTLAELDDDPAALLDIKEDVRDECEKLGEVTNVVLYDKEEDGVVTVRFSTAIAAQACVRAFHGRWFDKRQIEAYVATGKDRFKKTTRHDDNAQEEQARIERFSKSLEKPET